MTSDFLPGPSKAWYISAWILIHFLSFGFSIWTKMIVYGNVGTFSPNGVYWTVMLWPVVLNAAWLIIAVTVYLLFSTLEISKVVPWVWGIGALSVLDDFAKFFNDNSKSGQDSTTLTITVLSFILSALAFMWFFKTFKFYRY